jgi:hypothetical protein
MHGSESPRRVLWRPRRWLAVAVLLASTTLLAAQVRAPERYERRGEFVFTRIQYGGTGGFGRGGGAWAHDYPDADRNLSTILAEITTVVAGLDGTNVFRLDDEELLRYPIAYVSEPGFWSMSDAEARAAREYALKGGFLIFDDFEGAHWYNFEARWREAFPDIQLQPIPKTNPIFDAFYDIRDTELPAGYGRAAHWYGAFEDNDPNKRLLAVANYNADLGELMEYSDEAYTSIDLSNQAYKIMTNYVIYAMTH